MLFMSDSDYVRQSVYAPDTKTPKQNIVYCVCLKDKELCQTWFKICQLNVDTFLETCIVWIIFIKQQDFIHASFWVVQTVSSCLWQDSSATDN